MRFRELKLKIDPDCPVCGTHPTVKELIDYEQFCGVPSEAPASADHEREVDGETTFEIDALEHDRRLRAGDPLLLLDVREPREYEICRIPGGRLLPLGELPKRIEELRLAGNQEIVVHCRTGIRSAKAVNFMRSAGFRRARNLSGGILDWIDKVDPSQPKY
jgi:adenylyltransferase/sulfurtransferase